ncbi:nuclear transport factor 2 family protein [Streptomyces sp. NPDC102451]|uniref:nuclear transport factor 2 family protein n=1 Tax=Streptomyces sp. NPDC102451 TaxID=3366177 RepID=UPI0038165848
MGDDEKANLTFVDKWIRLHNTDPQRMVDECYAPDAVIVVPGVEEFGVARLRELESEGAARAGGRETRAVRVVSSGDVVVVEGTTTESADGDGGAESAWCVVLTIRNGLIVSDHAYLNTHRPHAS